MVAQKFAFVLAVLAAPSLALADKKPLPGSQHQPPVFLDETGTWVTLATGHDAYRDSRAAPRGGLGRQARSPARRVEAGRQGARDAQVRERRER